ncbi:hypothetical protein JDV02_004559 [Purpureocillium takamizusanense]|uniref:Uncharacterized protein n=1 Tax=Purpureocillium takamizusanense TaxID=2060973 RepID=A0A9Q8QFH7_9HYPO|nr:uncharacterized protein JDV02_004559 [Purpureocillium takamizusanense]UNI18282.1 hypothetical protein JDV02_004559 [Purpureocillium takamizusanense]
MMRLAQLAVVVVVVSIAEPAVAAYKGDISKNGFQLVCDGPPPYRKCIPPFAYCRGLKYQLSLAAFDLMRGQARAPEILRARDYCHDVALCYCVQGPKDPNWYERERRRQERARRQREKKLGGSTATRAEEGCEEPNPDHQAKVKTSSPDEEEWANKLQPAEEGCEEPNPDDEAVVETYSPDGEEWVNKLQPLVAWMAADDDC